MPFVVVTTDHTRRGVFAGELVSHDKEKGQVILEQAQMVVYWSRDTRGVVGLAAWGPKPGSRVGPPAPRLHIDGVTAVIEASEEARKAFEAQPWS